MLNDFWFRIDNGIISENMIEFADFVYEKIIDVKKRKAETPMTLQSRPPVSPAASIPRPIEESQIGSQPQSELLTAPQEQKEFSFIPSFLRKK